MTNNTNNNNNNTNNNESLTNKNLLLFFDEELRRQVKICKEMNESIKLMKKEIVHLNRVNKIEIDNSVFLTQKKIVEEFLEIKDGFDITLGLFEETDNKTIVGIKSGIQILSRKFDEILYNMGVVKIETLEGDIFNENIHRSTGLMNKESLPDNTIAKVIKQPYKMGENIVRIGQVVVNKNNKNL